MPIHLRAEPGDYAPNVLCPGDPVRSTYIAASISTPMCPRRFQVAKVVGSES